MESVVRKSTNFDLRKPNHHLLNRSRSKWHLRPSWYCSDQTPVEEKNIFPLNLRLKLRQRVVRGGSSSKQRCALVRNYVWSIWKSGKDTVTNTSFFHVCDYSSTNILRTPFVLLQVESKSDYNRLIRLHW